jgi:hypothetical protein
MRERSIVNQQIYFFTEKEGQFRYSVEGDRGGDLRSSAILRNSKYEAAQSLP